MRENGKVRGLVDCSATGHCLPAQPNPFALDGPRCMGSDESIDTRAAAEYPDRTERDGDTVIDAEEYRHPGERLMGCRHTRRIFLKSVASAAAVGATAAVAQAVAGPDSRRPVRLAICNETFGDGPFEKACAAAAECGYTGIEIAPFTLARYVTEISPKRRAEVRKLAQQSNLEVVGLHWILAKTEGFHMTGPDAEVRRKTADYLIALAQFCADVGGKLLVLGSPKQRNLAAGVSRAEGMNRAAEVLRAVVPTLEKTGVTIAIEPLTPKTTNFINTAADGAELIGKVASPYCRLHLDCLAMAAESTPIPDLIRKYRSMLVHFHANDPNGQGPGFGRLDFVPIFKALRDIDYGGWVSVEVFDTKPGGQRLARESLRYMRECLAKVAR